MGVGDCGGGVGRDSLNCWKFDALICNDLFCCNLEKILDELIMIDTVD